MATLRIPRAQEIPRLQENIVKQIPLPDGREILILLLGFYGPDGVESLLVGSGEVCLVEFEIEFVWHLMLVGLRHEICDGHDVGRVVGLAEGVEDRFIDILVFELDMLASGVDHTTLRVVFCGLYFGRGGV